MDVRSLTSPVTEYVTAGTVGAVHTVGIVLAGNNQRIGIASDAPGRVSNANLQVVGRSIVAIAPIALGEVQTAHIWNEAGKKGFMYELTVIGHKLPFQNAYNPANPLGQVPGNGLASPA